jgi:hypothetical protein
MRLHLVTCADWNYRRWTTTLINSLDNSWAEKFVVAVGEGDWEAYGAQLGVTIIHQPFNHAMDPIRWCQNVRMRHLRALIENCDWLLQVDSDVRQNLPFSMKDVSHTAREYPYEPIMYTVIKNAGKINKKRKMYEQVSPRFKINAGWCLYKNCPENKGKLEKIQQSFDYSYKDEKNWDQLQLLKHYDWRYHQLPFKYIDEGSTGGFFPYAGWFHCKGPTKKINEDDWHDLSRCPQSELPEDQWGKVWRPEYWTERQRLFELDEKK